MGKKKKYLVEPLIARPGAHYTCFGDGLCVDLEPDACTGCHLCEIICPEFAIGVEEVRDEPGADDREVAHAG